VLDVQKDGETTPCEPVELDEESALTIKKGQLKERESPSKKKKVLDKYEKMVTTNTISNEDPVNLILSSSGQKKQGDEVNIGEMLNGTSDFTNFGNVTQDLSHSTFLNISYTAA